MYEFSHQVILCIHQLGVLQLTSILSLTVQIPRDKSSAPQDCNPPIQMPIASNRFPGYHTSDYRLGIPMAPSSSGSIFCYHGSQDPGKHLTCLDKEYHLPFQ